MFEGKPADVSGIPAEDVVEPPRPQPQQEVDHQFGRTIVALVVGMVLFGLVALIFSIDNVLVRVVLSALVGGLGMGALEWLT